MRHAQRYWLELAARKGVDDRMHKLATVADCEEEALAAEELSKTVASLDIEQLQKVYAEQLEALGHVVELTSVLLRELARRKP